MRLPKYKKKANSKKVRILMSLPDIFIHTKKEMIKKSNRNLLIMQVRFYLHKCWL